MIRSWWTVEGTGGRIMPRYLLIRSWGEVSEDEIDGAAGRVASGDTAFADRDARFATVIAAMYPDPRDTPANVAWVREYHSALSAHSAGGGYVNFLIEEGQERVGQLP